MATAFNQPLAWDTSKVKNMGETLRWALAFKKPLNWDTSSVTNMYAMFYKAEAFNQQSLVWDTSKVVSTDDFARMVTARASRLPAARTHPCTSASAHRRARPASSRATSPL